jgi:signal transduction histidine kinase
VRHARATEVQLRITATENELSIAIEDNGQGFECAPDNASSDGLRNMRQRMEEIGGQFQLTTRPGAGTQVAFRYLLPPVHGTNGNPNMPYSINGNRSK